jgi:hypothetical protein
MILDSRNEFCDATALNTGSPGTYLVGDVIDLDVARDMGNGQPLYLVLSIDTAVDSSANGASVEFVLASDDSASIATDGTATEHVSTGAKAEATLTAGYQTVLTLPLEGDAYEQYLGILQKTTGEAVTSGAVNAFLTMDPAGWQAYPDYN